MDIQDLLNLTYLLILHYQKLQLSGVGSVAKEKLPYRNFVFEIEMKYEYNGLEVSIVNDENIKIFEQLICLNIGDDYLFNKLASIISLDNIANCLNETLLKVKNEYAKKS